jgi:hypothetical protein
MADASAFSPDYGAARARFRSAALALGCHTEELSIAAPGPEGEELTIDMARLGSERPRRAVVVSSGLHGVEGFFGSAVQAAMLEEELGGFSPEDGTALVLVHALNPFGFAWLRRVNEDNVDLNRNFLRPGEAYEGAPEGYAELDGLLNPPKAPGRISAFLPKAGLKILQHGLPTLKNAVAGGQYQFPLGVFFGGSGPSQTQQLLRRALPGWVGRAERVLHIDFHTGLGERATYKLFADHPWGSDELEGLGQLFGSDVVEPWEPREGTSYEIRGGLGTWCKALLPDVRYDVLAAEFGTVSVLKVIEALHRENRAWHWGDRESPEARHTREALRDTFAPPDRAWRDEVVPQGIRVVEQAIEALL